MDSLMTQLIDEDKKKLSLLNLLEFWCRIHLWFRYVGGLYGKSMTSSCKTSPAYRHACARNTVTL